MNREIHDDLSNTYPLQTTSMSFVIDWNVVRCGSDYLRVLYSIDEVVWLRLEKQECLSIDNDSHSSYQGNRLDRVPSWWSFERILAERCEFVPDRRRQHQRRWSLANERVRLQSRAIENVDVGYAMCGVESVRHGFHDCQSLWSAKSADDAQQGLANDCEVHSRWYDEDLKQYFPIYIRHHVSHLRHWKTTLSDEKNSSQILTVLVEYREHRLVLQHQIRQYVILRSFDWPLPRQVRHCVALQWLYVLREKKNHRLHDDLLRSILPIRRASSTASL